jgi:NADH-quinone oxidoreductase subunit N
MSWSTIATLLLPENLLLAGIVALVGIEIAMRRPRGELAVALFACAAATAAAFWLYATGVAAEPFPGHFSVTPATLLAKAVVLALALPVLLISREDFETGPFHTLLLLSLYGACLLLSSDSFLTLFIGLEMMSMPVYALVLLAYRRPESAEAALKYLVLGGAASAALLMGVSLLYGGSGSLSIAVFTAALESADTMARAGVLLVVVAFFVKAAVVPFHTWAPDAYEGASVPVTAFMATIVKAAVLLAAARLFAEAPMRGAILGIIALLPLVSIVWGNLAAMRQASLRRMIAYSSIAHAGYLFYAFLGEGPTRFEAVLFYVLAYGVMNLLVFAALPPHADDAARDRIDNLRGLYQRAPLAAVLIAVSLLSLAGIPPLPGFVAKFLIFKNVIAAGHTTYAVLGLVGSYLGIYFYLRVIQYMFMSEEPVAAGHRGAGALAVGAALACLAAAIVLGVYPAVMLGRV